MLFVRRQALGRLGLAAAFASGCASAPHPSILSASPGLARGEVVVAPGENACALGGRMGVDVAALRAVNDLSGPTGKPIARSRVRVPAEAALRHRVRKGETLHALARWYGHSTEALAASNGIGDPDHIAAGTWLRIPAGARTGCAPDAPAAVARRAAAPPRPARHAPARQVSRAEPPAQAEQSPPAAPPAALERADAALARAQQRYDAADFEAALAASADAQRALPAEADDPASLERRARARWLAGLANAGLDRRAEASAALREALALDPSLRDEQSLSPRILSLLEEAGAEAR